MDQSDILSTAANGNKSGQNYYSEEGADTDGKKYNSLEEMWKHELSDGTKWYEKADEYWKGVEASVDGMLGGFSHISREDLRGSNEFLKEFLDGKIGPRLGTSHALDCGSGIGRIAKTLLLPIFGNVDLLEQNEEFLKTAKKYVQSEKVKNFFCSGMQNFDFKEHKYDLIWVQWVTGHLIDSDFVSFLKKCKGALKSGGIIVIKENNSTKGFLVDKTDSSVTRTDVHIRELIKGSGLTLVKVKLQARFPKEIFPVRMYAIR